MNGYSGFQWWKEGAICNMSNWMKTCFSLFISFHPSKREFFIILFFFFEQKKPEQELISQVTDNRLLCSTNFLYFENLLKLWMHPYIPYTYTFCLCYNILLLKKKKNITKCWFMNLPLCIRILIKFWALELGTLFFSCLTVRRKINWKIVDRLSIWRKSKSQKVFFFSFWKMPTFSIVVNRKSLNDDPKIR